MCVCVCVGGRGGVCGGGGGRDACVCLRVSVHRGK